MRRLTTLVCGGEEIQVPSGDLIDFTSLFWDDLLFLTARYQVKSTNNAGVLKKFILAIGGGDMEVDENNCVVLLNLFEEFGSDVFVKRKAEEYVSKKP